jgi:small subunit ribosomal protein S13
MIDNLTGIKVLEAASLKKKRVEIALTFINGVGRSSATKICKLSGIEKNIRTGDLSMEQKELLNKNLKVLCPVIENDLKILRRNNIDRLRRINCYKAIFRKRKLPVRGQGTRKNARTCKGIRKTVAIGKRIKKGKK